MAADGEVVYEIRADDSKIDSDLDAAQKKVEQSTEKTAKKTEQTEEKTSETVKREKEKVTEHHKQQNDERQKDDQSTGKERENTEKETSEKIKSIASGTAKVIGAGMLAAATGAVTASGMAIKGATDMDQAMNQFVASTGKSTEETERYQKVLEGIYKNNYGESFEDIGQAMAEVTKQMGDMDDAALQEVTESAYALRDTFDYDIPESTRAAKAMMDNFGVSGEEAMSLIAAGAQNGLDYSGELLDSISEYSVQFGKLGLSADDMFSIFQKGAESGAFNLDKVGDAVKEFSIRAIDGSETTKAGFEALGLNADETAKKFAAGGDTAREAFKEVVKGLSEMEDPLEQNTAGVNLFGTMWEDLGPEAVAALAEISDGAYDTADAMGQIKEVKYDDLGSMLEGLKRSLELLLIPLGEQMIPILTELIESILPVIQEMLPPLMDSAAAMIAQLAPLIDTLLPGIMECVNGLIPPLMNIISAILPLLVEILQEILPEIAQMIEAIAPLINLLLQMLIPVLQLTLSVFKEVFSGIVDYVTKYTQNLTTIFSNLIAFVKNVFTGNWRAAWANIKNIFVAVADSLGLVFKAPINALIDLINGFLKGLNKIEIPDWVPGIGGKGFHIPTIPRLKTGIDFVPGDYFPAYLDYGERVLTQGENARFNAMGGLDGMERALSQGMRAGTAGQVTRIEVPVEIDGREVARSTAEYMGEQQYWEDI
ncbi:MAG: phage tail tape measure protein [Clostridiaceae bacterium]|nr:phage tail tape measure protein [Clostridiaceae bacterium]